MADHVATDEQPSTSSTVATTLPTTTGPTSSSPTVVVDRHWLTPVPHTRSVGSITASSSSSSILPSSSSSSTIMGRSGSGSIASTVGIKAVPVVESSRLDGLPAAEKARRLIDQCLRSAEDGVPLQHVSIPSTSTVGDVVFYEVHSTSSLCCCCVRTSHAMYLLLLCAQIGHC
jgi:hypothetical protein